MSSRHSHRFFPLLALSALTLLTACSGSADSTPENGNDVGATIYDATELSPGGDTSVKRSTGAEAYSLPAANLDLSGKTHFQSGDNEFEHIRSDQLRGPLLNAKSCQGCHIKDGRGNPPAAGDAHYMTSMFLRLSTGPDLERGATADSTYGTQLQTYGIEELASNPANLPGGVSEHDGASANNKAIGEAHAYIEYNTITGQYPDGSAYELRQPTYKVTDLSYGAFDPNILFSPRVAPSMIGLGLLEAIPEGDILALADPKDSDGNGISGRANRVWDAIHQRKALGRFGLKASTPSVLQQSAGAYRGDMGLTNHYFDSEVCTANQPQCTARANGESISGNQVDIEDLVLAQVEFYARTLAVPEREAFSKDSADPIWRGRGHFFETGCVDCHTPRHQTNTAAGSALGDIQGFTGLSQPASPVKALSQQTIWPYTDLLLHDMGGQCDSVSRETVSSSNCSDPNSNQCLWVLRCDGLADGRPDFLASGTEWRTPPLWGIGLVQQVNPNAGFLHDGRARNVEEAILWHGGEAKTARKAFMALSAAERRDLLRFVESM